MGSVSGLPDRVKKRLVFAGMVAYFFFGYYFCQWVNASRDAAWTLWLPGEQSIPLVPLAVYGYSLSYCSMLALYWVIASYPAFLRTARVIWWVMTVHFVIFLLFPVRIARPTIVPIDWTTALLALYYRLDAPLNLFPSLHVSYPFVSGMLLWGIERAWAYGFFAITAVVAVSVVFVKQHYIADIAGALVVTTIVWGITASFRRTSRVEGSTSRSSPTS